MHTVARACLTEGFAVAVGVPNSKAVVGCANSSEYDRLVWGGKPPCSFRMIECNSPVAPSGFDRLVWGYRLTETALHSRV